MQNTHGILNQITETESNKLEEYQGLCIKPNEALHITEYGYRRYL